MLSEINKEQNSDDLKKKLNVGSNFEVKIKYGENEVDFQLGVISGFKLGGIKETKEWFKETFPEEFVSAEVIIRLDSKVVDDSESFPHIDDVKSYKEYFMYYLELSKLHKKLGFGRGTTLATNFTEGICRKMFDLDKSGVKEYDALDKLGKEVEIKSSIYAKGNVSINKNLNFDYLIWIYFSIEGENKKIILRKYEKNTVKEYIEKFKSHLKNNRITIPLSSLTPDYYVEGVSIDDDFWNRISSASIFEWIDFNNN